MRFKIGQEIVCIKKGLWTTFDDILLDQSNKPKFNEIVTVSGYNGELYKGIPSIYLKEYKGRYYLESRFAPILNSLNEIKEVLKHPIYE